MVSDDETNAVVISVTDRPDQQVQSRTTTAHLSISSNQRRPNQDHRIVLGPL